MKAFFKRLFSEPTLPEGWTHDCSVKLVPGRTINELVDHVLANQGNEVSPETTLQELAARFLVLPEEAELALDRTLGGVVRAETGNPANCPDQKEDPVAWTSYQKATRDPQIIQAVRRALDICKDRAV